MSVPAIFGLYGDSDAGKTTLLVDLVSQFSKEGYLIATIKQTKKKISMDTKNKDTWRHHHAGAGLVVFSSHCETDFLLHRKMSLTEIIQRISQFGVYDLVLVEGADDPTIPKIQIGKGNKRSNTVASYKGNLTEIVTLIKKELKETSLSPQVVITVNGKIVPLTQFPRKIITNTILGMLCSLKGVQDITEVSIHLKR
ncbi:MAG: molybdopterin-guanine dinucleotide biosynthesis protein B [Thermoplasmata archaeon M11B2D]|nr:MAG: molybdopterin-guanine dinucleotide biosynthesis protein B [Thermoplasmata archaeon M11B2D]